MKLVYSVLRPVARRFPWLAKFYREYRDGRSLTRAPVVTPYGFKFSGNPAMEAGTFEPQESEIIRQYLQKAEVFINVGANIGYYCCMALQQKVPTVAFEPIDLNLKYLYKNMCENGWEKNIELFPLAIGNQSGLVEIYGGGTAASLIKGWSKTPDYYRRWVPISTLDRILGSRFEGRRCLILVDIEGAELSLLQGAAKLLELNPKPIWIVEICITEHMPQGVQVNPDLLSAFKLFWDHGYRAWTCDKHRQAVEKSEIEAIIRTGKNTLKTHNFIFKADDISGD
jgi:FkbM family methyltransferase